MHLDFTVTSMGATCGCGAKVEEEVATVIFQREYREIGGLYWNTGDGGRMPVSSITSEGNKQWMAELYDHPECARIRWSSAS